MIADQVGAKTPIKSLQMRSDTYLDANDYAENFLSYDKTGKALAVEDDPELLFNTLFKGFNNAAHRKQTASVLDEVKAPWYIDLLNINLNNHDLETARERIRLYMDAFKREGVRFTENLDFMTEGAATT